MFHVTNHPYISRWNGTPIEEGEAVSACDT